jgi:hypothetical protein
VSIDRDVLDAVRDMDEHELRRLLILAKARLEQKGITFPGAAPQVHLRSQPVKCGKTSCTRCPHGPYWYAYWWEDGKRRSRYLGKLEPGSDAGSRRPGPLTEIA